MPPLDVWGVLDGLRMARAQAADAAVAAFKSCGSLDVFKIL